MKNKIEIKKLSKFYKIYQNPKDIFKELIFRNKLHQKFWALRNISFNVQHGEIVGVIGRNGAGKSTLLKILAGTLDKSSGQINISGKISAILELGTGFKPEYTGRENIYNGGLILGMSKKTIDKKIQSIIAFSELEDFINRPLKIYSDGMKTRLAFSLATSISPDILIIDETLAAGDNFFVNKCIQKISKLCQQKTTSLIVSHNLFLLQRLCTRIIWIEKGKIKDDGNPVSVCQQYEMSILKETNQKLKTENSKNRKNIWGAGPIRITKVKFLDHRSREKYTFRQGEDLTVRLFYKTIQMVKNPGIYLLFTKSDGILVTSYFSAEKEPFHKKHNLGELNGSGHIDIIWPKLPIGEGDYLISVGIFPEKKQQESVIRLDPYQMHDKRYKLKFKRAGRPLQTIFDHNIKIKHIRN